MRKSPLLASHAGFALIILFSFTSCRNQAKEIPFPFSDSAYPQPVAKPMKLGAPKKLSWTTVKSGSITPEVKRLDIEAIPSQPFDSTGFKPLPSIPGELHLDLNTLPSKPFDLSRIESHP